MTIIARAQIGKIIGGTVSSRQWKNIDQIIMGLDAHGDEAGLNRYERIAQFMPQVAHESGRFLYDKEVWDGKGAQARYDIRTDLGNTPERDGDGKLFLGRTGMQLTGKANYTTFYKWCLSEGFLNVPDFIKHPDLILTDPWEGLVPIWYWTMRNINRYADANNYEMVTKSINGGLNGYEDRLILLTRTCLVLLDYDLKAGVVKAFQKDNGLDADDVVGKETRDMMHLRLKLKTVSSAQGAPIMVVPEKPLPAPDNSGDLQIADGNTTDAVISNNTEAIEQAIRQFVNHPSMLQYRN